MNAIRGVVTVVLFLSSLIFWATPVLIGGVVKFLLPGGELRRRVVLLLAELGDRFVATNNRIMDALLSTKWDVDEVTGTATDGHYLLISNHLSWVDIIVLFRVFHRKTALIRFFLKSSLAWAPFVGQAAWALDFPFMKRYSPEYLEKHPEKRGSDLATTRRACHRYRHVPVAILNFVEGTRFTREKQVEQSSPYRYLLRPRVGGVGFVLASLGDLLDGMVDVTIVYPDHEHTTFWDFVTNQIPCITVRTRNLDVPPEFFGDAITEPGPARDAFKGWIDQVWREKDQIIDDVLTARRDAGTFVP